LFLCFLASPAGAWHHAGHRITAEIAFDLLNQDQQRHVAEILRAHPRFKQDFAALMPDEVADGNDADRARWILAHAANWPDQVTDISQAVRRKYHRSTWHYINLPVFLTEQDETDLAGRLDYNISMEFAPPLRRDLNIVQALKGNLLTWRDDSATDADKAIALCWILHLTADLHEPLHAVALFSSDYFPEGDRGGNLIAVKRAKDVTNLHVVWDGLANRFLKLTPDENTRELLARDVADIQSIPGWARQYRDMAEEFAYTQEVKQKLLAQPPGKTNPMISLSTDYIETARKIAESQIIIAGHRIAALISN
jgi:hypothetical protein